MDIVRREEGGSCLIHNIETLFVCFKGMDMMAKIGGSPLVHNLETLFQITTSTYMAIFDDFGMFCFSPILGPKCDQNQKCFTVSVTLENKGGLGQAPYGRCPWLINIFVSRASLSKKIKLHNFVQHVIIVYLKKITLHKSGTLNL